MDKTTSIVEHIQRKYQPEAIILHGSRATGKNHEQSDWDIYMLVSDVKEERTAKTELWQEESIDLDVIRLPINDEKLLDTFGSTLLTPKIVYDPKGVAAALIKKAQVLYAKGRTLTTGGREEEKRHLERLVRRMRDTTEEPGVFFYHLTTFYRAAIDYWFDVHGEWSRPIYEALPLIRSKDPTFLKELAILWNEGISAEKVAAAERVQLHLFPNEVS